MRERRFRPRHHSSVRLGSTPALRRRVAGLEKEKNPRPSPQHRAVTSRIVSATKECPIGYRISPSGARLNITVERRSGALCTTMIRPQDDIDLPAEPTRDELAAVADLTWLRRRTPPPQPSRSSSVRFVDLFSGCGLMSVGAAAACRQLGLRFVPVAAVDLNAVALEVYKQNFPTARTICASVESHLDGRLGARLTATERAFAARLGSVDLVLGGPPCQGNSDLNNHTRRRDPKNGLYDRMARFAEVFRPAHLIIENVPAVCHDVGGVVARTRGRLESLGYRVAEFLLDPDRFGVPQRRKRHFILATNRAGVEVSLLDSYKVAVRTVRWAIEDLEDLTPTRLIDLPATPTAENAKRIDFLFDKNLFDLPDSRRPPCHRDKAHSYASVYGRLEYDRPSPTITTGFTCMGQGRFVHPTQRRTLTPHEAARLQFIPDFFCFGESVGRTALTEMIGNAVPPKLTYLMVLELLR